MHPFHGVGATKRGQASGICVWWVSDQRDGEVTSARRTRGQGIWMPVHSSCCGYVTSVLMDELVEKPQLEADFGYQTVLNTWGAVNGKAFQGQSMLQSSLSVRILPVWSLASILWLCKTEPFIFSLTCIPLEWLAWNIGGKEFRNIFLNSLVVHLGVN